MSVNLSAGGENLIPDRDGMVLSRLGVVPIAFFMVVWDWEPFYGAKPR